MTVIKWFGVVLWGRASRGELFVYPATSVPRMVAIARRTTKIIIIMTMIKGVGFARLGGDFEQVCRRNKGEKSWEVAARGRDEG